MFFKSPWLAAELSSLVPFFLYKKLTAVDSCEPVRIVFKPGQETRSPLKKQFIFMTPKNKVEVYFRI
jgi:hypothetical protein